MSGPLAPPQRASEEQPPPQITPLHAAAQQPACAPVAGSARRFRPEGRDAVAEVSEAGTLFGRKLGLSRLWAEAHGHVSRGQGPPVPTAEPEPPAARAVPAASLTGKGGGRGAEKVI